MAWFFTRKKSLFFRVGQGADFSILELGPPPSPASLGLNEYLKLKKLDEDNIFANSLKLSSFWSWGFINKKTLFLEGGGAMLSSLFSPLLKNKSPLSNIHQCLTLAGEGVQLSVWGGRELILKKKKNIEWKRGVVMLINFIHKKKKRNRIQTPFPNK